MTVPTSSAKLWQDALIATLCCAALACVSLSAIHYGVSQTTAAWFGNAWVATFFLMNTARIYDDGKSNISLATLCFGATIVVGFITLIAVLFPRPWVYALPIAMAAMTAFGVVATIVGRLRSAEEELEEAF
jgi:hypothetical protein